MIPKNINEKHIQRAISEILKNEIPSTRKEVHYSLVVNNKKLPPKYVLSIANKYANGVELDSNEFISDEARSYLKNKGFDVIDNRISKIEKPQRFWIEKTLTNGRLDRIEGERALGKALWSPQRDRRGADIYKNMREVSEGDIVLHLINNLEFSGVSIVRKKAFETNIISGTDWDGSSYLIDLKNYTELNPRINRTDLLNQKNKSILHKISENSEVFYNNNLDLRQGAYLTPCPIELITLINKIYYQKSSSNIPYTFLPKSLDSEYENLSPFDLRLFNFSLLQTGLFFSKDLVTRFSSSLLTKPFVILTGLSGSGKTKLAQAFSIWICENENQYSIVPVGADWTNREPLLGFPNGLEKDSYVTPDSGALQLIMRAMEKENETKPYFLILDEMNLSHVERYFADFLSVMESKEKLMLYSGADRKSSDGAIIPKEISWPKNLFIVGTVNIDETTYMFSPKVLDRANVIEFRVTVEEMEVYLKNQLTLNMDVLKGKGATMANDFISIANEDIANDNGKVINDTLLIFFTELKKNGAEFGYRSASEILRFAGIVNKIEPAWSQDEVIDAAIMQKLLPKLHGSRNKLTKVLPVLGSFCLKDKKKEKYFDDIESINFIEDPNIIYRISFEKICRMYKNAIENGYANYTEA